MNSHQFILKEPVVLSPRSHCLVAHGPSSQQRKPFSVNLMQGTRRGDFSVKVVEQAQSASSTEKITSDKEGAISETYSHDMTKATGAVLTYRHELGMNYSFIRPDLIVGSCLQTPADVDKLRKIEVKTIFCLQQDPDLEYFGVDIAAIQEYALKCRDIEHCRAEIRDFDAFDMRLRLPAVVGKLHKLIKHNGGVTYIHCTAGMGRAPTVAIAYMFWIQNYRLNEAYRQLLSKRPCFPKLEAIKNATADILTGISKSTVTLAWQGSNCSTVEVSGLDIGWGQRMPLTYDKEKGVWSLTRELADGRYEYKYVIDGEWKCNENEALTSPNGDGHVNNYVELTGISKSTVTLAWQGSNCSTVEVSGLDIGWGQRRPLTYDKEKGVWSLTRELADGRYEYKYVIDGEWKCNENEALTSPNGGGHVNNYVEAYSEGSNEEERELRNRLTSENCDLTEEERLMIREFLEQFGE